MEISGLPIKSASDSVNRLTLLLWGDSGCGKTSFACTAPGRKLIINFDDNGPSAVAYRDDVDVLDLSKEGHKILEKMTTDDPLGLSKVLETGNYQTVILDSITALSQQALERGVIKAQSMAKGGNAPSIEFPGLQGYGARTTISVKVLSELLRITGRYNVHFICITHTDDPERDDKGNLLYISMMLGGKIKNNIALRISEIWYMASGEKNRKIAIKECRGYKPMKSRMFDVSGAPEFNLTFDSAKSDDDNTHTLAKWWKSWNDGGKNKLKLP